MGTIGLLGIEPSLPAPKAGVPPSYASPINLVRGKKDSLAPQEAEGFPLGCLYTTLSGNFYFIRV